MSPTSPPRTFRRAAAAARTARSRFEGAMSDHVKKGQKYQNREAFVAHRNIKRAVRDVEEGL